MNSSTSKPAFYKRWTFWLVAIIFTPVLLIASLAFWGSSQYSKQIESLQAAGQPTSLAELNQYYRLPDGATNSTAQWIQAIQSLDASALEAVVNTLPYVGTVDVAELEDPAEVLPEARKFLQEQQQTMNLIREAVAANGVVRLDVDFTGLNGSAKVDQINEFRTMARLLCLDSFVAAADDDFQKVYLNNVSVFRLANALKAECTLIGQLTRNATVAIAIEQSRIHLGVSGWNDDQLAELQNAVSDLGLESGLKFANAGELAFGLEMLNQFPPMMTIGQRPQLQLIKYYQAKGEVNSGAWHQQISKHMELDAQFSKPTNFIESLRMMPLQMFAPVGVKVTSAFARTASNQRSYIAALAVERHRFNDGVLPTELQQVEDRYFPTPADPDRLVDPFTGQPLLYISSPQSFTVYSTGEGKKDDGGSVTSTEDQRQLDVGFMVTFEASVKP